MSRRPAVLLMSTLFMTACASTDSNTGDTRGSVIAVDYGTVQRVEQVPMQPSYTSGALVGGGLGALAASGHSASSQAGAAIAGALIGAFVQKERAGTADRYTVVLTSGRSIEIVTEHHDITTGDCVSIEQGRTANIRRVSAVMCNTPSSHAAYADMHNDVVTQSQDCDVAKQKLMAAGSEQEVDVAYRKMRAFCEH